MKSIDLFIFLLFCSACQWQPQSLQFENSTTNHPELYLPSSTKNFETVNETIFFEGNTFSGVVFEIDQNTNDTLISSRYQNGLLDGLSKKWFSNNSLMEIRNYLKGKKNGLQTGYWENGNKRFEFIADNDVYQGQLQEWTIDGQLIHLANFVDGQEEGVQKMWYENGKIRANYVIINGKRFGLLGTKNCSNVSETVFAIR